MPGTQAQGSEDSKQREQDRVTDHIDDTVVAQAPSVQAAEYVRMSTEHLQYSTENQRDGIREYAVRRGLEIVRTYADEGKSGLRIDGRQALQQLIKDVESGRADFQVILVYDVSRWGDSRTQMKVRTTSMSAGASVSRLPTAPNSSKTMARRYPPS